MGVGIISFCPLFQGLLTDKYLKKIPAGSRAEHSPGLLRPDELNDEVLDVVRSLNEIALARGQSLAQMVIAWILRLPEVTSATNGICCSMRG